MKIAVTAETPTGLESPVGHHFGRSPYYVLVTVEEGAVVAAEAVPNPGANGHRPGELPALIKEMGDQRGHGPAGGGFFQGIRH